MEAQTRSHAARPGLAPFDKSHDGGGASPAAVVRFEDETHPPAELRTDTEQTAAGRGVAAPRRGAAPTSLEASETNAHRLPLDTRIQARIHEPNAASRRRIWEAFTTSPHEDHNRRAEKLALCCSSPVLLEREDGSVGCNPCRCRDRLCPTCATRRGREAATRLAAACRAMDAARFLTLTAPPSPRTLAEQLQGLRLALRAIRRTTAWKTHVTGGCYSVEITRHPVSGAWHPHLHLVIDGRYFPHAEVKEAWRLALRNSGGVWNPADEEPLIVHIEHVHSRHAVARYIAAYISKPAAVTEWPDAAILEYADAVHGVRLVSTFGHLHGLRLDPRDPNEPRQQTCALIGLDTLAHAYRSEAPHAAEAVELLAIVLPHVASLVTGKRPPPREDRPPPTDEQHRALATELHQLHLWLDRATTPDVAPQLEVRKHHARSSETSQSRLWSR